MTIRDDLSKELDHLVSMMPVWQRWEKLKNIQFQTTKRPEDLIEYMEAHWLAHFMLEKVKFINKLLADNNE